MDSRIKNQLLREANQFVHTHVDTVCIKEFPQTFNHLGRRIGPFALGHPYRLEHYIVRIFIEQGYLKFNETGGLNSSAIQKINFQESTNPELRKIQDHVYVQAVEQLKILNRIDERDPASKREFRKLLSDLNDLIRVRLAKVTRLANQTPDLKAKKQLTAEEVVLFDAVSDVIQQWREYLSNPIK